MFSLKKNKMSTDRSFLPEDYLSKRAERRTNLISLTLFALVMVGVVGAFLVTNREWKDIQGYQEAINVRYSEAAKEIDQLKQLEQQKAQLLAKAELTTALIERVPRSILLAEIINRMPDEMTILVFELKSKRVASMPAAISRTVKSAATASRASPNAAAGMSAPAVTAPQYHTKVIIEGITISHTKVARFGASLQDNPLLTNVELKFSELTSIDGDERNKFRYEADIRQNADARQLDSIKNPRLGGVRELADASQDDQIDDGAPQGDSSVDASEHNEDQGDEK